MAKAPKNVIPLDHIKIDAGFRRNIKIVRDFPEANRSDVTEMLEKMLFDKAVKHDEAKVVSENAGSKGGKVTAEQKKKANSKRDAEIIKNVEDLKRSNAPHEIAGILAQRYKLSATRIREILRKAKAKHP